ncbi:MAG TPA: outer membrane protein assembly factor BamB [Solimonas sp.]
MNRARALRTLTLVCVVALAACSSDKNVRVPAELKDIASPALRVQKAWSASAGEGSGRYHGSLDLALAPDAVFAADVRGRVYAFNPSNGRRVWTATTDSRVISGPTVSGAAVLMGTMDGEVIALKRADGASLWRSGVSSEVLAPPVGDGDIVVARAGDGYSYGLSAVSGTRLWTYVASVPNLTLRGLSAPVISGSRVFLGLDNGRLAALRLQDGQPAWEQVVAAASGRNELERLIDVDGALFADGPEIFAVSYGGELVCFDADTGQALWRRPVKSYSGIVRAGELVVVSDEAGTVWALDARTGAAAWKNEDLQYRRLSAPGLSGDYVVVGDLEGYLHWFDPKDGRIVARIRAGKAPIQVAPQSDGERLYVLDTQGTVAALTVK